MVLSVTGGNVGDLDVSTNLYMSHYREMERQAEKEVMGHVMKEYDWALYTEPDRKRFREEINRHISLNFQQRYAQSLN